MRVLPAADGGYAAGRADLLPLRGAQYRAGLAAPGDSSKNVYLPEAAVLEAINAWIGSVFDPARRDETVQ